jgi:multidrug efflux pump subunit AcrA (membrane-fusion protein)
VVIVILILIFAIFIGRTLWVFYRPAPAARPPAGAPARPAQSAAGAPQAGGQGQPTGGAQNRNVTAIRATAVELGTIENSVVINGDVLARSQVSIYPIVPGKLTEARLRVGDTVRKGQVVAMVDRSQPGETYSLSPVESPVAGTVLQAPYSLGDTVSASSAIYVVGDLSSLVIETFVPERYSNAARRGLEALVSLEGLPGETFAAVVDEVSPVLDPASRTLRIRLSFPGRMDSRIKAGMFATVSLVTNTRSNVPVIPRAAVINTYGFWIVFTVNNRNIAERKVITLGLENENQVEVLSGLEAGDRVVSAGQNFLTDGDPVRVID